MTRYFITVVCGLISLATSAQSVLLLNREDATEPYVYKESTSLSFWGQPKDGEINGDLTIVPMDIHGKQIQIIQRIKNGQLFDDFGFYLSETQDANTGGSFKINRIASYDKKSSFYSLQNVYNSYEDYFVITMQGLTPHTTYYIKPYVQYGDFIFGSEKSFTTQWTIDTFLADAQQFGNWYTGVYPSLSMFPTAEAWDAFCKKYKNFFGDGPSETMRQALVTEWFRHLTPAEANLLKSHSVGYYDNIEFGNVYFVGYGNNGEALYEDQTWLGNAYVLDKVCDDMIPNLLKTSTNIDVAKPNLETDKKGKALYTTNCNVETVDCDASYGIEGNRYVKTEPTNKSVNPSAGYDLPFMLLPNSVYNVSVTIVPNTEDVTDVKPQKFRMYVWNTKNSSRTNVSNPQPTAEGDFINYFVYGGSQKETFTFQIDTHDEALEAANLIQFQSFVTSKEVDEFSRTMRIAEISVSPVVEVTEKGDADMDGKIDTDDVQSVVSAVVLGNENPSEENPSTDFTGDGKTLIDDVVALVNFIQTGNFKPVSSKARAPYAAASAPVFTTEKNMNMTAGEPTVLSVDMSGLADYTAISFDIKVPRGVYVATDENGRSQVTVGDAATAKHHVNTAMQEDDQTISVACYADDNACFKSSGSILKVALATHYDMDPTENATISLANCMVTKPNLSSVTLEDYLINMGITNDINKLETSEKASTPESYYTINGIQLSAPQKGLNLVKLKDGQVKKIFVK